MKRSSRFGLLIVLLSGAISILWGWSMGWASYKGPVDFQAVYYGARTLIEHQNPYSVSDLDHVYLNESGRNQPVNAKQHELITLFVNTPGALLLVAPFALLPIKVAQILWMLLTAGSLVIACLLVWSVAAEYAPVFATVMVSFLLLNCQVVIAAGNTAAIVVGLCVIAAWCFLRSRFVTAGVFMMAISLAIKPHDSGLVLLFFVLAGSQYRKPVLKAALITALIYVAAVLWLSSVAPTWLHDWQTNLATISAPGGMNDPRPASVAAAGAAGNVISLQAVFSVFSDRPGFYNLASYAVCGLIVLPWAMATERSGNSQIRAWFALAAIAPLTMLVVYHRVYDAKLLVLCIPAAAALWAKRDRAGWAALILTSMGIFFNADIPLAAIEIVLNRMPLSIASLSGKILTLLIARPNQVSLLAMSLFFVWTYLRKDVPASMRVQSDEST